MTLCWMGDVMVSVGLQWQKESDEEEQPCSADTGAKHDESSCHFITKHKPQQAHPRVGEGGVGVLYGGQVGWGLLWVVEFAL